MKLRWKSWWAEEQPVVIEVEEEAAAVEDDWSDFTIEEEVEEVEEISSHGRYLASASAYSHRGRFPD